MKNKFTPKAEQVMKQAMKIAGQLGAQAAATHHLLYGLCAVKGTAAKILAHHSVKKDDVYFQMTQQIDDDIQTISKDLDISPRLEEAFNISHDLSEKTMCEKIGTEHLLAAILLLKDSMANAILTELGVNAEKIFCDALAIFGVSFQEGRKLYRQGKGKKQNKSITPVLDKYSKDLNELAREGKLDPVLNRKEEIQSTIQILSRRAKNNPCLIGEPGVGKTAVIEGLAMEIEEGNVPATIADKRILTLDLSGMIAGAKYRGEFEERIKRAIQEAVKDGNILLFIDEIHTVIGAGSAEGSMDASNILKPFMARGELQVIGATTRDEYRKHIEKDAALERRFQPVVVEEPSAVATIGMLKGLRPRYEEYHQITITDAAIDAAVRLSIRYMNDRFLPDKAIDLIDEAAAHCRLANILNQDHELKMLQRKKEELLKEKEEAIVAGDFDKAKELRAEQEKNEQKIKKEERKLNQKKKAAKDSRLCITEEDVAEVLAAKTNIPVSRLQEEEMERLQKLEEILHNRLVGQKEAVTAVSKAIRRGRVGLKNPKRPIGSFLFLGPTGVGKTELSKALSEAVFGSEKDMIRVDMSEYMEKHSVSKMIGSPPGYVGFDDGGQLSELVRRKPYSVILFDEVEKAHPDVLNLLLQILEDGQVTDSKGKFIDFKNTIIIMTSNAGAERIVEPKTLGFNSTTTEEEEHKKMKNNVMEEVKRMFKPEFLNRLDEVIVFHMLQQEHVDEIAKILAANFIDFVKKQMSITLSIDEAAIDFVAKKGFDKNYGARPLRRVFQTEIEDTLADAVLMKTVGPGDECQLVIENEKICVKNS